MSCVNRGCVCVPVLSCSSALSTLVAGLRNSLAFSPLSSFDIVLGLRLLDLHPIKIHLGHPVDGPSTLQLHDDLLDVFQLSAIWTEPSFVLLWHLQDTQAFRKIPFMWAIVVLAA